MARGIVAGSRIIKVALFSQTIRGIPDDMALYLTDKTLKNLTRAKLMSPLFNNVY